MHPRGSRGVEFRLEGDLAKQGANPRRSMRISNNLERGVGSVSAARPSSHCWAERGRHARTSPESLGRVVRSASCEGREGSGIGVASVARTSYSVSLGLLGLLVSG